MKKILCGLALLLAVDGLSAQNVGIGTSSPSSKLHVIGNTRVDNGSFTINDPFATLFLTTGNQSRGFFQLRGASYDVDIGTSPLNTTGNFTVQTNGIDRIVVEPGGYVGIGKANPSYELDLAGDFRIENGQLRIFNSADLVTWGLSYSEVNNMLRFQESGVNRLVMLNGGNIGIGTSAPSEMLEVSGNMKSSGGDVIIDHATAILQLQSGSVNKGFVQLSGDNFRFGTNSGNIAGDVILRMDGTDMLEFGKTAAAGIFMQMNLNGVSTGVLQTTSTGNVSLTAVNANAQVQLGGEVFINNTANMTGIGTSSPSARLQVNGNMIVNGNAVIDDGRITGNATGSAYNLLPLAYGRVNGSGTKAGGTLNFTSVTWLEEGNYEVSITGLTASSVIVVTAHSPVTVQAYYDSPGKFKVRTWSPIFNDDTDSSFHFVIFNP